MTFVNDPWIEENSPIESEKLHALGVIQFRWNACEFGMRIILANLRDSPFFKTWEEYCDSKPSELTKEIRRLVLASRREQSTKDAVLHAIKLYDVNRRNRNQLVHFLSTRGRDGGVELRNNKNRDFSAIFKLPPVPSDLTDIRRIATEIQELMQYLVALANWFNNRNFVSPSPLPGKPPLPEIHWMSPRP